MCHMMTGFADLLRCVWSLNDMFRPGNNRLVDSESYGTLTVNFPNKTGC